MPTITIEVKVDGVPVAVTAMAGPRDFKSGSRGYWGQVRPTIEGKRYIASIPLVEIGSKNSTESSDQALAAAPIIPVNAVPVPRKTRKNK
jgi:hypothetical protein